MSTLAAILSFDGGPVQPEEWSPMAAGLREFGADRQWHWAPTEEPVVLLRALDELTPSDRHARAVASAGDWMLVGDVRLDARDDLARALGLTVREAEALCDEQLFVQALAKWGVDAPARLEGGFGVSAWERSRRRLHLWRDANGERPVYFHRSARRLYVAGHAPVLLATPGVPRELDLAGLLDFMNGPRRSGSTSLKQIEALGTACHHVFHADGGHEVQTYWQRPDPWAWTRQQIDQPAERLRELFTAAVSDRLRTLGAKGGFCSGGLDSTSIAAVAAAELAKRGERYLAYTSVPHPDWKQPPTGPRWENDDSPYVRALTQHHPNIHATLVAVDGTIFLDCLPQLFRETAAPAANPTNLPWALAIRERQQAAGVRVPFVGGGGNGGVSLDSEILLDLLGAGRFGMLAAEWRASPHEFWRSIRVVLQATKKRLCRPSPPMMLALKRDATLLAGLASPPPPGWPSLASTRRRFSHIAAGGLGGAGYAGLHRLDPTKDRRIVEFCGLLPPQEFRHGTERRRLIRRAMTGLLPDTIRLRTTRGLQSPDLWLHMHRRREDLRAAFEFVAEDPLCASVIDIPWLRACLRDYVDRTTPGALTPVVILARTLSFGLYIRWINDQLDDLPGRRPIRSLAVDFSPDVPRPT